MKKILIVGGSHSEIPLITAAKELGLYVITTGNQPYGLGHTYADEFHLKDYADNEGIYQLAKKLKVDYITFGAHDLSMFSTVYTAEKLNIDTFDNYETTKILHHKDSFKAFAKKHNILTPIAHAFNNETEAVFFAKSFPLPFIVKPTDMGGGKGIQVVHTFTQIHSAIQNAFSHSKNKSIVIESFFKGSLHSFSTFIQNQKVVFYYADNEYPCPHNPYGVCTSTSPATNFDQIKEILLEQTNKVAKLLNLKDGLLHMQYLQHNNTITTIEYTRRMPGDMYNVPVEHSTGIDYAKNIIRFSCGLPVAIDFTPQKKFVSRHCIVSNTFNSIIYQKKISHNIFDKLIWGNRQRIEKKGIIFLEYNSYEEMIEKTQKLHQLITIR